MATPLRWLAYGLVALGAAVTGAYVHERLTTPQPAVVPPPVHVLEAIPKAGDAEAGVPEMRPDFTLKDASGHPHPISEWDGRPLMINFWASWCAPCRREIPLLNRLQAEPALKDLQIVGIAVDFPEDVQKFLKKIPVHYPILVGEQDGLDTANAFGVQAIAFPFTAFVDRRGHVLSLHLGELHEDQARTTLATLDRVDRGELTPAAGREALRAALAQLPKPPPAPAD